MEMPVGLKKAATLCILRSNKGFLLLRRNKEPHLGKYIPVGGKLEPFEAPMVAAIREVKEETGIALRLLTLIGMMTETSPTKFNWINYIFTANVQDNLPGESDEGILEWVPVTDLDKIPTPETDRFIYDFVARNTFFVLDAIYDENISLERLREEITGKVLI